MIAQAQIRATISLDKDTKKIMSKLPRDVSLSAIVRVMLKAISMSEKDFDKYKASSGEAKEVRDYLREKSRFKNISRLMM